MARGRTPRPKALNDLRGDPGKRRSYEVEPEGPQGLPVAPADLSAVARAEWDFIVPLLSTMGVLSLIDAPAIVSYCEAWSRYRYAAAYIEQNGFDGQHYRHAAKAVVDNQALVKAYLLEFGCTAAARARMRIKPDKKPKASKWGNKIKFRLASGT